MDKGIEAAQIDRIPEAGAPIGASLPCVSDSQMTGLFSSSSKFGHGGARENSGGPRENSGGARVNSGGPRENSGGARPGSGSKPRPVVVEVPPTRPDRPRWYCVRSYPGADYTADTEIRLAGFEVFRPTVYKPPQPARRDGWYVTPALQARTGSLFPGYMFVRFCRYSARWEPIRELPGVDYILGARPDTPSPMPERAFDLIRSLCSENGCSYPPPPVDPDRTNPIPAGASVLLASGAMIGLTGICQWSDGKRVRLLMEILGRGVAVTVQRASVEAV